MRSIDCPVPKEPTACGAPGRIRAQNKMSRPATSQNCNSTSPTESHHRRNHHRDGRVSTPEQIVGSHEMMRLIASALRRCGPGPSRSFHPTCQSKASGSDEISAITGIPPDRVLSSISAARDHLRKSASICRPVQRTVREEPGSHKIQFQRKAQGTFMIISRTDSGISAI